MRSVSENGGAGGRKAAGSGRGVRAAGRGAGPGSVEPHRKSLPDGRVAEPFVRTALVDHVQGERPRRRDRVREPHGRRCLETVDLDTAEVGVFLHLPGRQIEPGNRGPRGGALREMHLHPLGVEVVAGLDAPAKDGKTRFRRRRLHPEREVRMEELGLVAPGVDELLKEAGGGFGLGVGGGGFRRRARPAEGRFGPEAGKGRQRGGGEGAPASPGSSPGSSTSPGSGLGPSRAKARRQPPQARAKARPPRM